MTTAEHSFADTLGPFFGVVVRGRSYLNAVYNLLAFTLGVGYFVFLFVGLSLGFGLLIIWVGVIVLAGVLLLSWGLSAFERQQAILLLGATIGPMGSKPADKSPAMAWMKAFLSNRVTWTGPMFLFLKFPLGLFSFVFAIGVGTVIVLLACEHATVVRWGTSRIALAFFTLNGLISCVLGVLGAIDIMLV